MDFDGSYLAAKSTAIIFSHIDSKYLLGLLNSRLISFYYNTVFGGNKLAGGYLRIGSPQLRTLPIHTIDSSNTADKTRHDRMVSLVESMLNLHKQLSSARVEHDKTLIQRQISATDRQIDKLVYELYGLTEEEIAIVEERAR